jgi:hypothetical protein
MHQPLALLSMGRNWYPKTKAAPHRKTMPPILKETAKHKEPSNLIHLLPRWLLLLDFSPAGARQAEL